VLDVDATVHNAAFLGDFETLVIGMAEKNMIAGHSVSGLDQRWTADVGQTPLEVTLVGGDRLIVANSGDGTLSILDAETHAGLDTAQVGDTPVALWATPGGLFVSLEGDQQIAILNPGNLTEVTGTYDIGGVPGQVASAEAGGEVWIAVEDRGVIEVRASSTGELTHTIELGGKPHGVLIDGEAGLVYVTDEGGSRVVRIDAASHEVKDEIAVGEAPNGIVQNSL
jgi:YVTN family beta-propeller protein